MTVKMCFIFSIVTMQSVIIPLQELLKLTMHQSALLPKLQMGKPVFTCDLYVVYLFLKYKM